MTHAPFSLPSLPYDVGALAPAISARTLELHHGKHHKAYIDKTNALAKGEPFAGMSLEGIIKKTAGKAAEIQLFHNAAQAWNHAFLWRSLSPSITNPAPALQAAIVRDFATLAHLQSELTAKATDHFASGWLWLVAKNGALSIVESDDADTPMAHGDACLLTIDLWEHAYYLDYQNERKSYVEVVVNKLLNWDFASDNFAKAVR